ncbi:DUF1818 family protein [Pleurocapsales cyanobacterium LEGE 10410]|nr:DUF1818 family protein [Pleurocapsales cyanobacterium LEGE 10410]
MKRFIQSGDGYRVGWHPQGSKYQGLVGTDDWAIELTKAELQDFCRLLGQLVDTMVQMETELMDREKISCEAETDLLWLEVEGYPNSYSLRLILNCDRRCEGNWREGIAPKLNLALAEIKEEL